MEEKRPGQTPDKPIADSDDATAQRTAPLGETAGSGAEDAGEIERGQARARADREAMRKRGFGDHKGVEGFS